MQTKFMAVMGPSGVGKSTIMHELQKLDSRFVLIKTHVTRPLRPGERDRVSLSLPELKEMRRRGEALQINHIYGAYDAALPKKPIEKAMEAGLFPMCDYKIMYAAELKAELSGELFCIYLLPPNPTAIISRLEKAGRKIETTRLLEDSKEIASLETIYESMVDLKIVNREGEADKVAREIRLAYLKALTD